MSELGLLSWVVSLTAWSPVTEITITTIITTITTLAQREKKRLSEKRKRIIRRTGRKTEIKERDKTFYVVAGGRIPYVSLRVRSLACHCERSEAISSLRMAFGYVVYRVFTTSA